MPRFLTGLLHSLSCGFIEEVSTCQIKTSLPNNQLHVFDFNLGSFSDHGFKGLTPYFVTFAFIYTTALVVRGMLILCFVM